MEAPSLDDLFSKGRKIIFTMEFVYKEVTCNSITAKGKRKKKSATEAQRLQRAADAGLWTQVYERYYYKAKYCKQGPHCWPDKRGTHYPLLPRHPEDIVRYIKDRVKEGEMEEDVDVTFEIPPHILKNVLDNSDNSRKRKADDLLDYYYYKVQKIHDKDRGEVKGIDRANLRSSITGAWYKSRTTDRDKRYRLRIRL
jgi:hypothetical protein